ncbi:MAG: DNA polymerase III subunit delta [Actinomycetota bacterium]|nr:DNA polymerase III subunit delta [Actinomycetota bacterium]
MSPADRPLAPIYLVQGADPALVSQALSKLLEELAPRCGGSAVIEEYGEPGKDEPVQLGPVLDACMTPPFLTDRRLVVLRALSSGLDAAQAKALAAYVAAPLDSTVLVVALSGKAAPAALAKAVKANGEVIQAEPGSGARAKSAWFTEQLRAAPIRLDGQAAALLEQHLGEDLARLSGIVSSLTSTYGEGARLSVAELTPFLGEAGGIAPWDLTGALDRGDIDSALGALARLLGAGGRHPLQVLAILARHYGAMLRLDGAGIADEQGAAAATGLHPFPAKRALEQSRRLGHDGVARAIALLAGADVDLRGRIGWPPNLVMEVLVARLAQLARRGARTSTGRASAPGRARHMSGAR